MSVLLVGGVPPYNEKPVAGEATGFGSGTLFLGYQRP